MEHARAFLTTYLSWVKPSTFALVVGVVTTISTVIGTTSNAVPVVLKTLNLPDCLTYANVYRGTQSDFQKEGAAARALDGSGRSLAGAPAELIPIPDLIVR